MSNLTRLIMFDHRGSNKQCSLVKGKRHRQSKLILLSRKPCCSFCFSQSLVHFQYLSSPHSSSRLAFFCILQSQLLRNRRSIQAAQGLRFLALLDLCLSVSLPVSHSMCMCVSLPLFLSLSLFVSLPLSLTLSVYVSHNLPLSLTLTVCVCLSLTLFVCVSYFLPLSLSHSLCICLYSLSLSLCSSTLCAEHGRFKVHYTSPSCSECSLAHPSRSACLFLSLLHLFPLFLCLSAYPSI